MGNESSLQMGMATNFDADEIRRLGKRFKKLDLDNSGSLSVDEFMSLPELQQVWMFSVKSHVTLKCKIKFRVGLWSLSKCLKKSCFSWMKKSIEPMWYKSFRLKIRNKKYSKFLESFGSTSHRPFWWRWQWRSGFQRVHTRSEPV